MAPSKLFLDYDTMNERWKIYNSDMICYGEGETPEAAILSARVGTDAPIYANKDFGGLLDSVLDVPVKYAQDLTENDTIYTKDELIEVLAELGGFRVSKVYGAYHEELGYTMELIE